MFNRRPYVITYSFLLYARYCRVVVIDNGSKVTSAKKKREIVNRVLFIRSLRFINEIVAIVNVI